MTVDEALLRAISEHPEEDTPRLMYADWLDENGESERAEFVRVQVELDRMDVSDPARRPWVARHVQFLIEHVPAWKSQLPQLAGIEWGDFNRGLVEEVQARDEKAVIQHANILFAEPAVHVLRLARLMSGRKLAGVPELSRLRTLRLISARTDAENLRDLFASPHLQNLLVLDLHNNGADDEVARDLADGRFPTLTELWLGSNPVGNAGSQALAASPHLGQLRVLDLRGCRITDAGVRSALIRRFKVAVKLAPNS